MFVGTKLCNWSVKTEFPSNYVRFPLWMIKKQASKRQIVLTHLKLSLQIVVSHFQIGSVPELH